MEDESEGHVSETETSEHLLSEHPEDSEAAETKVDYLTYDDLISNEASSDTEVCK